MQGTTADRPAILCVDDEKSILLTLERQLHRPFGEQFDLEFAESGEEALEILEQLSAEGREVAMVISDQIMPGLKGDELLIEVHRRQPEALKILMTGQAGLDAVRNAINRAGLYRYILKPWEPEDFVLTVSEAVRSYQQQRDLRNQAAHNHLLKQLTRHTQRIASQTEPEQIFDLLVEYAWHYTRAEEILVLYDPEDAAPRLQRIRYQDEEKERELKMYAGEEPEAIAQALVRRVSQALEAAGDYELAIAIQSQDKPYGYLFMRNPSEEAAFEDSQREILTILTQQAGIALENARLIGRLGKAHQSITDSLFYAKNIQQALLPQTDDLLKAFPEVMVYYKPRDIVSGDFYWHIRRAQFTYLVVADCTGHGVPGALMSVLGASLLNEIFSHHTAPEPAEVLERLNTRLQRMLRHQQSANVQVLDGMDLVLVKVDTLKREIAFADANRPLALVQGGQLEFHMLNRRAIGYSLQAHEVGFQQKTLTYAPGAMLYLFTDGMTDQTGLGARSKLTRRRLAEVLLELSPLKSAEQEAQLGAFITQWREGQKQLDDMLLVGVRLK